MADTFRYDVFLSYNSKDKPRVRRIAERLKQSGLRVWFDKWNIGLGKIISGLEYSRVLVLCISPNALGSGWIALERSTAIHRDPSNKGRRFIPLLLADCDLPDTLRRYHFIDFRKEDYDAFKELLTACRPEATLPTPVAGSPIKKSIEEENRLVNLSNTTEALAVLEHQLKGHRSDVTSIAVSPDGKWAASGSEDATVRIWDLTTGRCRKTLADNARGHADTVRSVAITPDGNRILSASDDHTIKIWDASTYELISTLHGHTDSVQGVIAFSDNARALSVQRSGTVKIWHLATNSCVKTLQCESDSSIECVVNPSATQALLGYDDGQILLWDLETSKCLMRFNGHSLPVTSLQIAPRGRFAVSSSRDQTVKVWDLESGNCTAVLEGTKQNDLGIDITARYFYWWRWSDRIKSIDEDRIIDGRSNQ